MVKRLTFTLSAFFCIFILSYAHYTDFVDPKIGSEGLGRTFIGPSVPYGMIKPSPDAVSMPNSGWAPMPEPIKGFSQTHVSGTGGGQKYGNVLIMPFLEAEWGNTSFSEKRISEKIETGFYSTTLENGITIDISCLHSSAIYNFIYPKGETPNIAIDAGAFLGMNDIPDQRETQQFVGSEIEIVGDNAVRGYNRVRGGWNNGKAYTVYFYATFNRPFKKAETWKGDKTSSNKWQSDTHQPTGALLNFESDKDDTLKMSIAISFLSELKAYDNLKSEIANWDIDAIRMENLNRWEKILSRIELAQSSTEKQKKMFYTGIYHTMLMPSDRTGENPLWSDDCPYYDDFYAIWDTYRTSTPMITILDPKRQADIVNSLLNIYKRDGYMPDARSGNSNGRTQGGSNAEIVIADAFAKALDGIDYEFALEAMLKDAEVAPGGNEEEEGRGGLIEYNSLGYIPFGIPRAGNRTVEYSYCDYAIAQVALGCGRDDLYNRFMKQSSNWKNLWRDDYEHEGIYGFIMPRDANGQWLDSLPQGASKINAPQYKYTPMTFEGPWYTPWWSMFFYEAPSWEYSLSIPHDVEGLIEKCGGKNAFEKRLDIFFDKNFYNVNNEPSFLSPCLYHWIGKPWKSSDRIREIVNANFDESPMGLPGNDDSGAMSSWLAFHLIGLYPNAGQDYYLINSPMVESAVFHLDNGQDFVIEAYGLTPKNKYIVSAKLNGKDYPYSAIRHKDMVSGGKLQLKMGSKPSRWGKDTSALKNTLPSYMPKSDEISSEFPKAIVSYESGEKLKFVFKPHGQTRKYEFSFTELLDGSVCLQWGIERNLKWQSGSYIISKEAMTNGDKLDFSMPVDGEDVSIPSNTTAYMISHNAYNNLMTRGEFDYNNMHWVKINENDRLIHVKEGIEDTEMWILKDEKWPIIWKLSGNKIGVNYTIN